MMRWSTDARSIYVTNDPGRMVRLRAMAAQIHAASATLRGCHPKREIRKMMRKKSALLLILCEREMTDTA